MTQLCTAKPKIAIIERTKIEVFNNLGWSIGRIAAELGRSKSSIHYELARYKDQSKYRAAPAQHRADMLRAAIRKTSKASDHELLHRIERLIKKRYSPEIISHELGGAVSHTTIYSIIRTIRPEWRKYLICHNKRKYHKGSVKILIPDRIDISARPPDITLGDIEADTVISSRAGKSCLGVFADRATRVYRVVKMLNKGADEMVKAAVKALSGLPVRTITYDNGTENAKHVEINRLLGCESYFCRPYHSWEKGLIENRNKILRQYLPKGTNFDLIGDAELARIEKEINERPMKSLGWDSPNQALQKALSFGLEL
jgi:IS30 family transposase